MKVAIVYDRVNKFGGAERVLLTLHKIFPDAPIYTLVFDPEKAKWTKGIKVIPTFVNHLPFLRTRHELLSPIAPLAFETFNFDQYDLVISVTSSDAKAIITKPNTVHVCYCLTPTRYFWSGHQEYSKDIKMKILPKSINNYFRTVDLLTSQRPDVYIAISNEVKRRIKEYYHRESTVIYPAIDDKFYSKDTPVKSNDRDYYLIVSRLVPYKSVDLAIKAFNKLNKKLIVVGDGSEKQRLMALSKGNILFAGQVNDDQLIDYYRHAKALIFPQKEDYGLVPIESQACGTPVIAYGKGGALETVIDHKTGIFFKNQTVKSLINAINRFETININYQDCVDNSKNFSESKFIEEFTSSINKIWSDHQRT